MRCNFQKLQRYILYVITIRTTFYKVDDCILIEIEFIFFGGDSYTNPSFLSVSWMSKR